MAFEIEKLIFVTVWLAIRISFNIVGRRRIPFYKFNDIVIVQWNKYPIILYCV